MNFSVAVEAQSDCVLNGAAVGGCGAVDMINFDLYSTESVAHTAPSVALLKKLSNYRFREFVSRHFDLVIISA